MAVRKPLAVRGDGKQAPARVSSRGLLLAGGNIARAIARAAALLGAVVVLGMTRTYLPLPLYVLTLAAALGALYVAGRNSGFRWWFVYVLGFGAFAYLRTFADETGVPWQYDYVVALERAAALGTIPTVWLQDRLYTPGEFGLLENATYAVYVSYFFAVHMVAILVWRNHRALFPLFVIAVLGTYWGGLAVSFAVPTAPPWLAANEGLLPHIHRIVIDFTSEVSAEASEVGYAVSGSNPVAAMPSLHMAISVTIALFWARIGGRVAALGAATYAVAMGFALIYLGEHYFADVVAGAVTAWVAWRVAVALHARYFARATDTEPTRLRPPAPERAA
jgi:membrane-associated phospholipid phosphatase